MRRAGEVDQAAVERVEVELAEAEVAFAERERQHGALLSEVAADVALGACSAGDGAERVRPSEEALEFAREHVEGLRRAVPAVRLRLEQQRAEQAERERQAAAAQVARAYKAASDSALALQKILGQADNAARSLVEARASVDGAVHDSAGAQTDDASLPLRRRSPDLLGWGTGRAPDGWV